MAAEIFYETVVGGNNNLFALSDIHGDLHSFIITLRDCAKVIGKIGYRDGVNVAVVDPVIEANLIIDISAADNGYDETLGYEWIGGDSRVVICGDIIDPHRPGANDPCTKNVGGVQTLCGEYPQIEIKLLRFINALNALAMQPANGGRIYKLFGNHELANILTNINLQNYIFPKDLLLANYYRDSTRATTFNVGNPGFRLLMQDGCGFLIKINNTICVHGQLPNFPINEVNVNNQFVNNPANQNSAKQVDWNTEFNEKYNDGLTGPLWERKWADINKIDERLTNGIQSKFCAEVVIPTLRAFLNLQADVDVSEYRVVLGHCPQVESSRGDAPKKNITIDNQIGALDTPASKTYNGATTYVGEADINNQNRIFGITMQCPKAPDANGLTDFYVYHVDSGTSRGFDQLLSFIRTDYSKYQISSTPIERENKLLFSKTPQVLSIVQNPEIANNEIVTIIKSKMKNTRIHLPRPDYEASLINSKWAHPQIATLNLADANYDKKYLKYKKKYLELKKKINK